MQSSGGIISKDVIAEKPVLLLESGPAAGVIASAFYAKELGIGNILSLDIGGTSAKAGIVIDGSPEIVTEYEVGGIVHMGRILKGSGYPVKLPLIDLAECGAGGGTIAWVDAGGALRVGPLSAGADPGPACYGKGGENPTVTDANVVLGRLNPEYLLGGEMRIYSEFSEKTIKDKICELTRLDLVEAANGIVKILNLNVTRILRIVSIERGYDPRRFVLNAFGGLGPTHACSLANELRIPKIIVPVNPGLFSAYGLLSTDFVYDLVSPVMKKVTEIAPNEIEDIFRNLETESGSVLRNARIPTERIAFTHQLDMRYFGQAYELIIPTRRPFTKTILEKAIDAFHQKHEAIYGYAAEEIVEIVNARLRAIGETHKPRLGKTPVTRKTLENALLTHRDVFFEEFDGYVRCPVYAREKLKAGLLIEGPAIIEQYDTTTVISPNWKAYVDEFGNLIMTSDGKN
jgi:N-methylhydantoinase A